MLRRPLALSALSGILLTASFPSPGYSFLAWFALIPFLIALRGQTVRAGLWLSGIFAFVFFCGTVYWIAPAIHFHGNVPLLPAALINLLLCLFLSLYIVPFGGALVHIRSTRRPLLFLAAPALWVVLEYARTHVFPGFPWALLGYSQYRSLPVIQFADLTGIYGVSFLIVLVNIVIAELIEKRKNPFPAAVAVTMTAVVLGYGHYRLNVPEGPGGVTIAVVQGNIEQDKKWDTSYQQGVIAAYERLTLKALEDRPDLIIWPETAIPFYFGGSGDNARRTEVLRQFVRTLRTPLLLGSATYDRTGNGSPVLLNSAYLLASDGGTSAVYHKMHLVPFGEYVPFRKALFFVDKIVPGDVDFQAWTEPRVMQVRLPTGEDVTLGTVICYEIIFPDLVRRFVNGGAAIVTTITNDAWFGRTGAPEQHFSMAVFRAVENRVPIARAANTGISGFIDAKGRILETTDIFTEAVRTRKLSPGTNRAFYTRYGDVFAWLCVLVTVATLLPSPRRA